MSEKEGRTDKYRQTGHYYIPTETYDLLWTEERGEWRMTSNACNFRSCIEMDKEDREIDVFGYEIIAGEFCLDPGKYELEQVRYMNPLELEKLRFS
jgi:hypothetical protein